MNVCRMILSSYRRRRKQRWILLFPVCFVLFYWFILGSTTSTETRTTTTIVDESFRANPIFSKYLQSPFDIDLFAIIDEANRKYRDVDRYLVYSCPFMCGGKEEDGS